MRAVHIFGITSLLLTVGCSGVKPPVPVAPPQPAAPRAAVEAEAPIGTLNAPPSPPAPTIPTQGGATPVESAPPQASPPMARPTGQNVAKAAEPSAKAPTKAPPPAAQAPKQESIASDVAKPKEPPLDLASLEQRLKDTKAIGVLTKITLKNQVDDLLNQFRAYYEGKLKTTLAELRRPYDLLVLKVLALLQDSDPALAAAIVASREAIWGILADPAKFAKI